MPIAFDAATSGQNDGQASITLAHTVSGSDRLLVVKTHAEDNANPSHLPVTGITYNGVALTKILHKEDTAAENDRTEIWYLIAPSTGTNNVVINFTDAVDGCVVAAESYTGVSQTSPLDTSASFTTTSLGPAQVALTTAEDNELIVDAAQTLSSSRTLTTNSGQTQTYNVQNAGQLRAAGGYEVVGAAGSYTQGWALDASADWIICTAAFKTASSGSTVSPDPVVLTSTTFAPTIDDGLEEVEEETPAAVQGYNLKRYIYKVYDQNSLVKVWSSDVITLPSFSSVINGSAGQLVVGLARAFDDFGENEDVKLNNRVDCYVFDVDEPQGLLLYRGYISSYQPKIDGGKESVDVVILPYFTQASNYVLRNGSATTVTYNSQDPSSIFNDILNKFLGDGAYSQQALPREIDATNSTVSYSFNTNTVKEAIDKCVQLAPLNWFYRVEPNGVISFKQKPSTTNHSVNIGNEVTYFEAQRRLENIVNEVYFTGGGEPPLFRKYERSGSVAVYGRYAKKIVDQRVELAATAETIATKELDEKQEPETRLKIRIIDNNGSNSLRGYDIESIKVGQTLQIKNLNSGVSGQSLWDVAIWDVDVWDYTLQSVAGQGLLIVKTTYHPSYIEIETSSRFPEVAKRIEDINRNLIDTQTKDNPSAPS